MFDTPTKILKVFILNPGDRKRPTLQEEQAFYWKFPNREISWQFYSSPRIANYEDILKRNGVDCVLIDDDSPDWVALFARQVRHVKLSRFGDNYLMELRPFKLEFHDFSL
jgi:hypothetical protein